MDFALGWGPFFVCWQAKLVFRDRYSALDSIGAAASKRFFASIAKFRLSSQTEIST
jgi:hypothetical protein